MNILVIDGQGGRIGRQLVKAIRERFPQADVTARGHQQHRHGGNAQGRPYPRRHRGEPGPGGLPARRT